MTNIGVVTGSEFKEMVGDAAGHMTRLLIDDLDEAFAFTVMCRTCEFTARTIDEATDHLIDKHGKGMRGTCANPEHNHQ